MSSFWSFDIVWLELACTLDKKTRMWPEKKEKNIRKMYIMRWTSKHCQYISKCPILFNGETS
jgi:hypothetical protein